MNPKKQETKIKIGNRKKYKEISHELLDWLQGFRQNWLRKVLLKSFGET